MVIIIFKFINIDAQNKIDSSLTYTTDSIIVESTRYLLPINKAPFSIELVDLETIQNNVNQTSLSDILQSQSGIFVSNRNNLSQGDKISIRGIGTRAQFGIRGIKIFLDGIPLTFSDGQSQLNNLDIDDIETIEILKGPSSVLYGNALGGAIIIKSKRQPERGLNVTPKITLGSFGFKKISFNSAVVWGDKIHIKLNGYSADLDGFRNHSESKFYGLNFISNFQFSEKINLSFIGNYYNSPYLLNPSTLNKIESKDNPTNVRTSVARFGLAKKVDQLQNGIVFDYILSKNSKIKSTIFYVNRSLTNSIPGRFIQLKRDFGGIRIEINNNTHFINNELYSVVGFDYEFQNNKRKEFINEGIEESEKVNPTRIFEQIIYSEKIIDQNEKVNSIGFFSHIQYKLADNFSVFTGLRYDQYLFEVKDKIKLNNSSHSDKIDMNNTSLMLGINYNLLHDFILYGNFSTGFQTPTTNELSNNPFENGGFNKSLKPEKVNNFEIGLKSWWEQLRLLSSLSVYYMNFTDLLISYQTETEENYYRNVGKANNIGADIRLEFNASENLKVISAYSLMNFRFSDYIITQGLDKNIVDLQLKNKFVPGIPNDRISFVVQNYFSNNFYLSLHFNYVSQYFTNDFNGPIDNGSSEKKEFINNDYSTLDLNTNYRIEYEGYSLKLSFKLENIFNERYNGSVVPNAFGKNFFEPAPGRSYFIGMALVL